ncbi:MAG: P1 family peptidase [Rhodobacteraceae bacterium]|nr:P1 family peptidase [Paracoccaceae bacterium]
MRPGPRNLLSDVSGLRVGNADDGTLRSGVTVVTADAPFVAGVSVMGGAPGTRETDLLAPDKTVQQVDALVLSGGSAFGLDAASGVADALRNAGRGFAAPGGVRVPIVPAAILFDLANAGQKDWAENPYRALGRAALAAASEEFALGSAGAGRGATISGLKGGLGSASVLLSTGYTVAALVAVNAIGSVTVGTGPHFWAAPWEVEDEFGGFGHAPADSFDPMTEPGPGKARGTATTIAIVATDAVLDQAQATRMAVAAHDGLARAIVPAHTPLDGDLVFAAATGARPLGDPLRDTALIGHAAAVCLARAVARGVWLARSEP